MEYFRNSAALFLIVSIPILYILGHIIQIFDLIISWYFAQPLQKFKWDKEYKKKKRYAPLRWLYYFFAASTAEFQYKKREIKQADFNEMKYFLITENKYNSAEYYYLIRELFNGLRIFTFFLVVYLIFDRSTPIYVVFVYSFLYVLFWIKAII